MIHNNMYVYFLKHKDGTLGVSHFLKSSSLEEATQELFDFLKKTQRGLKNSKSCNDYVIMSSQEYENNKLIEAENKIEELN
jgi:hypothetical protein